VRDALVIAALALAACKDKATPPVESPPPSPVAADAIVVDAAIAQATAQALPPDFPKLGAPPLTGALAGKSFEVAKAVLRTRDKGTNLDLYAWSEGAPCEPQLAPDPHQLYISVSFGTPRFVTGKVLSSDDEERTSVIYKKPDLGPVDEQSWTIFDEITDTHAKGRMLLVGPDGTRASGSFEATVCAGAQKPLAEPAPIHGLAWGTRGVVPAKLPKQPVTGVLLGKLGAPVAIEVIDWKDVAEQHEVHFYFTQPKQPCQFDQYTLGFKVGLGQTIKAGITTNDAVTTVHAPSKPFAAVLWEEPGNVIGMEAEGWLSATIDKVTKTTVEGRVFAWFDDASKSMIAGAFVAKNCNVKP
jgi:hypothetical protein